MLKKAVLSIALCIFVATMFGGTSAQEGLVLPRLTWQDAPDTPPLRNGGDVQVRLGRETREKAYGPFVQSPFVVGDRTVFNILSSEDQREFQLFHRSQHAYFWFAVDAKVDQETLRLVGERFDRDIWPTTRSIYGENATPGIDGDPRIHLVHLDSLFPGLAGFFSPDDQCARTICDRSNERDVLYLILDQSPLNSEAYLATLAHEFQHMIQFTVDGNEYRWLDEGLSQLAELLNGFAVDPINQTNLETFLSRTNHPLNTWSNDYDLQSAHYGAGFLFAVYLYEQFGAEFIRQLARNPLDGLAAVDDTLQDGDYTSQVDDVALGWWVANLTADLDDSRYRYAFFDNLNQPLMTPLDMSAGIATEFGFVEQYGVRYWQIDTPGTYTINLNADASNYLILDTLPHTGNGAWWSYNANFSATSLTRVVDLTGVQGATFKFWLAGKTGEFPGHLHVLASRDGREWDILRGNSAAMFNRFSTAPGAHYVNTDGQWIADFISLDDYAGEVIQLRFEYVTNSGLTGPGFLIDSVSIPEIGWFDDMETPDRTWLAEGFVHTSGIVDQNWGLAIVNTMTVPQVQILEVVDGLASGQFSVPEGSQSTIVLGSQAPFTLQPANYSFSITQQ